MKIICKWFGISRSLDLSSVTVGGMMAERMGSREMMVRLDNKVERHDNKPASSGQEHSCQGATKQPSEAKKLSHNLKLSRTTTTKGWQKCARAKQRHQSM